MGCANAAFVRIKIALEFNKNTRMKRFFCILSEILPQCTMSTVIKKTFLNFKNLIFYDSSFGDCKVTNFWYVQKIRTITFIRIGQYQALNR